MPPPQLPSRQRWQVECSQQERGQTHRTLNVHKPRANICVMPCLTAVRPCDTTEYKLKQSTAAFSFPPPTLIAVLMALLSTSTTPSSSSLHSRNASAPGNVAAGWDHLVECQQDEWPPPKQV